MRGSKLFKYHFILSVIILTLAGCQSTSDVTEAEASEPFTINQSYLKTDRRDTIDLSSEEGLESGQSGSAERQIGFERLEPISSHNADIARRIVAEQIFGAKGEVKISANDLSLTDFIHYVFGDLLKSNYVIDNALKNDNTPITLNVQNALSKNALYDLVSKLLAQRQVKIEYNENSFFFHKPEASRGNATVGVGREFNSVPNVGGKILQVVQFRYGIKISLERTLNRLVDAEFIPDFSQNSMFILGDRANVIRALELINMLDVPAHRGKFIALLTLEYIAMDEFTSQVVTLLTNEGIEAAINNAESKSVLLVPLDHIGAIAVFASSEEGLQRVRYWSTVLDRPTSGVNAQYFVYSPKYARAKDLGASVQGLMGIASNPSNNKSTGSNADSLSSGRTESISGSISGMFFVVDERTNTLIFNTTGDRYLKLLPLLQKLDVLPKQIMLEVMIAEVTLTDNFKYGVEFALKNDERFNGGTQGAFGVSGIGGLSLNFLDNNLFGTTQGEAALAFFRQNQFVNVLSNPTLLVRDGTSASINVGTEIPVTGGTTVNQGVQQTNINYRETGVSIEVTPTLNAQGVVIMNISQEISNVTDASTNSTTPSIFTRALSTEAVVESGQTVILGGLISENVSRGETKVPILGDIPLIGSAFRGNSDSSEKTELIMIVTPRVIEASSEWDSLIEAFSEKLNGIKFVN